MAASKVQSPWIVCLLLAVAVTAIWWMYRSRVPTNVAYVSEEDGAISVLDLKTLSVVRRVQPQDVAPRGVAVTVDGKYLVTSDKNTQDLAVFNTPELRLVQRLPLGSSPEFLKLNPSGDRVFATFEPSSTGGPGKPPGSGNTDDDTNGPSAQIASFHVGDWRQGPTSTAGQETEGIEFSRDGKRMLAANEAQDSIGIFDAVSGAHLRDINLTAYGIRPRGVKASPKGNGYAITMEASGTLLEMDADFNVVKVVPTGAKPYGLAFDRAGKRIFVAAAEARKLQVFSADSMQLIAEIPTGQRCWHFTFTPDDSQILLACGRSNNVIVVDANSYKSVRTIEGFRLPWGIVTYPKSYGSLDLP
jgi:DNA-binding beta-propeller fold protein YncE